MPAHPAAREYLQQLMNQQPKRSTLFRRPGVCRASPAVQTAFITDSDTVGIKTFYMCTDAFDRAGKMHRSVFADVVVIACSVETTVAVHQVQSLRRKRTIPLRGGTMHHDQIDNSHVNK